MLPHCLIKKDASIVDIFWGLGFVMVGWASWQLSDANSQRGTVLAVLTIHRATIIAAMHKAVRASTCGVEFIRKDVSYSALGLLYGNRQTTANVDKTSITTVGQKPKTGFHARSANISIALFPLIPTV